MLSSNQLLALSYGLNHQTPIRYNKNNITTEFETFRYKLNLGILVRNTVE